MTTVYRCKLCNALFKSFSDLLDHIYYYHKKKVIKNEYYEKIKLKVRTKNLNEFNKYKSITDFVG